MRLRVRSLASFSRLRIWRCHELWRRLVAAILIRPLAWEPLYTTGVALKKKRQKKKKSGNCRRDRTRKKKRGREERKEGRKRKEKKTILVKKKQNKNPFLSTYTTTTNRVPPPNTHICIHAQTHIHAQILLPSVTAFSLNNHLSGNSLTIVRVG